MAKSRVSRKRMFRDFSKIDSKSIQENGLKNIYLLYLDAKQNYGLSKGDVEFLFFIYDLEFWTIEYVAKATHREPGSVSKRLIYHLIHKGLIYKHFDKLSPSNSVEDFFFRDETKYNYRVRYALSQQGRLLVARLYRKLRGEETIKISLHDEQGS